MLTDNAGPVEVEVPRDREGSFEPVIVKKRQRRLTDVDAVVLSLYARGLTTGRSARTSLRCTGRRCPRTPSRRITDKVIEDMQAWSSRPLQRVYAAIFIDAIMVKVRDGQVGNQPFYAAIGVDLHGHRDVLGLWAGHGGGESAKFWMGVLTDIKNRGVADVFFIVCDGLKGLPDWVNAVFPAAIVQTCIVHLIRGTFRYASKRYWEAIAKDLRPIYTAANATPPGRRSRSSRRSGARPTRRSPSCGATHGSSSSRSWTTTSRSARCSAPPTRSSRSTPATGERSTPRATSPPSRPR